MLEDEIAAYLPERIKPFREQLKQFPANFEKWVYASSVPTETYQGDVFAPAPFVCIDENGDVAHGVFSGMVISNTCDVQPRRADFVLVAPVIDLEDYRKNCDLEGENLENHIRALTRNELSQLMFLPDTQGLSRSFVDFGKMCSISLAHFYRELANRRLLSFSQCGHYIMLIKLAYHLSRPEAQDAKRL